MNKKRFLHLMVVIMATLFYVSFVSCGGDDDDDIIDTTPISLLAGKDKVIQGADTISSSNRFVAYGNKDVVHAWHVGETSLLVNGKKTITIKVLPVYRLYDDPICNWGCDMNYVKNNQKEGMINSKSTNDLLVYDDAGAASNLVYSFENGKLKGVTAFVSTKYTSQYSSYLAERFLMLPYYKGENTYFIGADDIDVEKATTVATLQIYNLNYLATVYLPAKDYIKSTRLGDYINSFSENTTKLIEELLMR